MNPTEPFLPARSAGRQTLGVIAKLAAVIVATFVFAAFSTEPDQSPSPDQPSQSTGLNDTTPNHSR